MLVRVLLDEQLPPRQLGPYLIGHEVRTVQQGPWAGRKNGELLDRAEATGFGALVVPSVTSDVKCFSVGHRLISVPISESSRSALQGPMPSICERSTPVSCC